ncbi:MAG: 3-methyl-2-oxobutanoate hydroxymethyltransferase [Gemmatimonadaceae bacterium]
MASKVTLRTLNTLREHQTPAVFITAYDYPTATFAERAGVDMILVGDSAAMTMMGFPNTLGVCMDEMIVFVRSVCRATKRVFVVGDLPFLSYQPSDETAVLNAGRFIAEGCDAVKCEGGVRVAPRVRAMVDAGINVMGHLGLTPQNIGQLSGYRVQGKTRAAVDQLVDDAIALQEAGAFAILLEAMPAVAAEYVREQVDILVYGIGAGPHVDGQLVISHDILGNFVGDIAPRFAKQYASIGSQVELAIRSYAEDVRSASFPAPEHCYPIEPLHEAEIQGCRAHRGKPRSDPVLTTCGLR